MKTGIDISVSFKNKNFKAKDIIRNIKIKLQHIDKGLNS